MICFTCSPPFAQTISQLLLRSYPNLCSDHIPTAAQTLLQPLLGLYPNLCSNFAHLLSLSLRCLLHLELCLFSVSHAFCSLCCLSFSRLELTSAGTGWPVQRYTLSSDTSLFAIDALCSRTCSQFCARAEGDCHRVIGVQ